MIGRRSLGMVLALLSLGLQGCVVPVRANGVVRTQGDLVEVEGSNGKRRAVAEGDDARTLGYLDGLLIELEGTLRGGKIDVDAWRVAEGPHGLSAWTGILRGGDEGYWLDVDGQDGALRLGGSPAGGLASHVGRPVLIEGMIDGAMSVQVLFVVPLYGGR